MTSNSTSQGNLSSDTNQEGSKGNDNAVVTRPVNDYTELLVRANFTGLPVAVVSPMPQVTISDSATSPAGTENSINDEEMNMVLLYSSDSASDVAAISDTQSNSDVELSSDDYVPPQPVPRSRGRSDRRGTGRGEPSVPGVVTRSMSLRRGITPVIPGGATLRRRQTRSATPTRRLPRRATPTRRQPRGAPSARHPTRGESSRGIITRSGRSESQQASLGETATGTVNRIAAAGDSAGSSRSSDSSVTSNRSASTVTSETANSQRSQSGRNQNSNASSTDTKFTVTYRGENIGQLRSKNLTTANKIKSPLNDKCDKYMGSCDPFRWFLPEILPPRAPKIRSILEQELIDILDKMNMDMFMSSHPHRNIIEECDTNAAEHGLINVRDIRRRIQQSLRGFSRRDTVMRGNNSGVVNTRSSEHSTLFKHPLEPHLIRIIEPVPDPDTDSEMDSDSDDLPETYTDSDSEYNY